MASPPPPSRSLPPTRLLDVDRTQEEDPQQQQQQQQQHFPQPHSTSAHALDDGEGGGRGGRHAPSPSPPSQKEQAPPLLTLPGLLFRAKWASEKCLDGVDYVGAGVAGLLGITDSRFQYIVDNMSEKDKEAAEEDLKRMRDGMEMGGRGGGKGILLIEELAAGRGEVGRKGRGGPEDHV